ncbi:hypothetical protein COU75_04810 [Candidatus Peregrinibacteria bacterium CG10_big_fil_rev_8_21_14_0_10_42_8]|nr:MAG: hypothetical protein COU75_04810 [Candidatus Peregrinibacteria bacterium CG10_big_fil_rev_8_21_14_0_10_42_8]
MSITTIKREPEASTATVEDRIAKLPENEVESAKVLQEMRSKEEAARDEIDSNLDLIKRKLDEVLKRSLEKNMKPDERLLAGIRDRYALSSGFDVDRSGFDTVLGEIEDNNNMLNHIRSAEIAFGAEWTIVSISDAEILFMDTREETNVEAQEKFLSDVDRDGNEYKDAVQALVERFPTIEQHLERADDEEGLHYYDYLVVCEITGAEPMLEEQYRKLQEVKPVDREKICWLLTDKARLDRGLALRGVRRDDGVYVDVNLADLRFYIRAGRPLLRVQRKA